MEASTYSTLCYKEIGVLEYFPLEQQQQQQPFNGLFSTTTWVSRYQKGKTNLDFTGARDSECQWHQLGHMQVCTSLQTDNHASTPPLCFFIGRMPFLPPNQQRQSTEGITSPWNFVTNSRLSKFCHGKSITLSTKLVVVGRVCWRHMYNIWRVVAAYYKLINCNLNYITSICCGFVVPIVSTIDKILTDSLFICIFLYCFVCQ